MLLDSDANRLRHMLDAAQLAVSYSESRTRADLDSDLPLTYFLVKNLEIIGEAASRVSREFRDSNPQIPWREATDLRNHLVHVYFDIDNAIIWKTTREFLPELVVQLRAIIR